jgi:hypothetical protein
VSTTAKAKETQLADALLEARTSSDVDNILGIAGEVYGALKPRPVGDRPNNIGTIRVGSDPALGLVERVTNGMDALLHLGKLLHPGDKPTTPREAAQLWYGVPFSGLTDMTDAERRELGEHLQLWLDESGEPKRPTVVVEDKGTGQTAAMFPRTLLSLNEQNKVGQPWTMGTYGQGGAVTFGFSEATIIISRAHRLVRGGNPDTVAWTIVQRYEDYARETLPSFKYLVGDDNQVFELAPSLFSNFDHGTRITHVAYDLQGWTGPFTTGIWQLFHAALFDPVLPFLISGKRAKEREYGSRIVIGNAARLARVDKAQGKPIEVAHNDSTKLDLGERYGSVVFDYWVVRRPAGVDVSSEAAAGYVQADTAVSMTLFGQRQDTESRSWIKSNARLPFLYKNMIVQINADGLTPVAKAEIFSSTRERGTKSDSRELIYRHLAEVLRNDEELKRLNHEEKERLLQKSAAASSEKVQRRLAKFIKTKLKDRVKAGVGSASEGTGGKRRSRLNGGSRQRDTDDSHLPNFPTVLSFERKNIKLLQGSGARLWVHVNAKNGYLPAHDDDLMLAWEGADPGAKVSLKMRSKLLGGKSRWFFEAGGDAVPGDYTLRATLITPAGLVSDSVTITVEVPPPAKPEKNGSEPETGPRVEWVTRDTWDDHEGMDARTVGYVSEDEETIIWVNRHYSLLDRALSGRSLTHEQIETRASRYQFPVACALWLQHDAASRTAQPPDEGYQKAELGRVAEAVLVAIDPDVDAAFEEGED